jgi:murein DD-endopeptidase MepM/ murein hydrolase activator NlpD
VSRDLTQRPLSLALWISGMLCTLIVSACSTFVGPGGFKAPDGTIDNTLEENAPNAAPIGPTLSWSGERYSQSAPANGMNFDWPVNEARMSRGFLLGKRWHYGVDLASRKGTPILASEAGTVIYVGKGFSGYGKLVVIEHNETWATLYSHLNKFNVKEGTKVARGEQIAEMGRTGRASGVHLHFEIRYNRQPVNPLMYLPQGFLGK